MPVSTLDQNEKRQLEGQVLDRVVTDKASGRDTSRPQLTELLRFAREGDTVVVHSMDRRVRNLDDLRALVEGLTRKGVRVEFVTESLVLSGEDSSMANSCSPLWGRSLNSNTPSSGNASGNAEGRHRPGQAARRLQRAEKDPHVGTGGGAGPARRQRCLEGSPCP
ncbi:hypothetical protein QFZ79_002634 [Arthrobacter sp. V4I6]|nr:hypothetical protein [Arthrobacter sp. V1I7]MDQ0854523.1 hypothetical protein [Arthrobacter sp. V4I6]